MTSLLPAAFAAFLGPLVMFALVLMVARAWDTGRGDQPVPVRIAARRRRSR